MVHAVRRLGRWTGTCLLLAASSVASGSGGTFNAAFERIDLQLQFGLLLGQESPSASLDGGQLVGDLIPHFLDRHRFGRRKSCLPLHSDDFRLHVRNPFLWALSRVCPNASFWLSGYGWRCFRPSGWKPNNLPVASSILPLGFFHDVI